MIIDEDHLMYPVGDAWQQMRQILRLVTGRNYDAYPRAFMLYQFGCRHVGYRIHDLSSSALLKCRALTSDVGTAIGNKPATHVLRLVEHICLQHTLLFA